ncbi:hypothetical protein ACFQ0K_02600 [Nocardioides caeni]|uniref:TOMM leader peptide-binding protein n=1 Tax=Nocardioides caeni TaxID=574700 RepID=A0A4S8NP85_9ACTN|nr:hypothetical protein [Nocardioides caeni]THV18281.1 hypothetical protein E9934_01185 [Nocardioides caeni]
MGTSTQRLTLRPGTPVLLREPGLLQVGLHHPAGASTEVRILDTPDVRRLLDLLRQPGGASLDIDETPVELARVVDRLDAAELVVEVRATADAESGVRPTVRAQFGRDAERRLAARAAASVAVEIDPTVERMLEPLIDDLIRRAGLRRVPARPMEAAAHLVVASGVLDRERVDPLVQGAMPHLVVSGAGAGMRVGPFVDPGRTACLRCVDAHEALPDPRRPLLLCQAARQDAEQWPPRDDVLDLMALAWATRDLARFVEGDRPSTWSATADFGPRSGPLVTEWGRHPECGCAWDAWIELP